MRVTSITLICLLLTLSCSRKEEKTLSFYRNPQNKAENKNSVFLNPVDTINIQVSSDKGNRFLQGYLYKDSLLYAVSLYEKLTIDIYDIKRKQFVNEIKIEPGPTRTLSIANFAVASPDSIFIIPSPNPGVHLINSKSELIKIWDKYDLQISESFDPILADQGFGICGSSGLQNVTLDNQNNIMYMVLSPLSTIDEIGDPTPKRHGIYDLKNSKWIGLLAPYEGVLKNKGEGRYYFDMHHPYQLVVKGKLYVTYPVDHRVYVYNIASRKLILEKDISPTFATQIPEPLFDADAFDYNKLVKLRGETAYYGPLYYHPSPKVYSRFYNLEKKEGKTRERAIIIYDKDFNIISENVFPIDDITRIQASDDGFYVQPQPHILNADTLALIHFKICSYK